MAPVSGSTPEHIPAWKKIGLKLKYAKEELGEKSVSKAIVTNFKKRKVTTESGFAIDVATTDSPTKKSKKSKSTTGEALAIVNGTAAIATPPRIETSTTSTVETNSVKRRKSVAFTPETKTQDGESSQQLFQTWHANWVAEDPSFDPSTISPALKVIAAKPADVTTSLQELAKSSPPFTPSISAPKEKKAKKPKKKRIKARPSLPSQPTNNQAEHPALKYLTTYHTSRETWKFSKPHQNHLLRHLFSLTHIPSSYDTALLTYLRGLEGASARSRIRQQGLAIRTEDAEWLASEPTEADTMENETHEQCIERRRREYEAAVKRVKERLRVQEDEREEKEWEMLGARDEWEWKLKKRRRAEVVLWGVGEEEDVVQEVATPPQRPIIHHVAGVGGSRQDLPRGRGTGMGGVEEISGSGIAKGSQAKKIVFGDDGAAQTNSPQKVHGIPTMNGVQKSGKHGAGEGQVKRKRKRKRRTTGVPDDDSSSDSSSSSSSGSESEGEKAGVRKIAGKQQAKAKDRWIEMERSRPESVSSSDSGSGSDSDGNSD
ncbi:hypothetical protein JMJ35_000538 [Cladonia borealis]|uniref:WKF domain-containing protein n=1 Tax=Cladonia borealis TaxID=184061 RepID=A0AA39R9M1_9LECA|nr:hypothetical protein JMJ35_000538 [Cladonia borealis]